MQQKYDKFGNLIDPTTGYARGQILKSSFEEERKRVRGNFLIRRRIEEFGLEGVFNFTGLDRRFPLNQDDIQSDSLLDGYWGPAYFEEKLSDIATKHLGGNNNEHSSTFFARTTAGIVVAEYALVKKEEDKTIISVVPKGHSHPSIARGAELVGAKFIEICSSKELEDLLKEKKLFPLVVITGTTMLWDIFELTELKRLIKISKERGLTVFLDDAAAGVRTVYGKQPPALELGVDLAIISVYKAGFLGPRCGFMVGRKNLIDHIQAYSFEFGVEAQSQTKLAILRSLEKYDPHRLLENKKTLEEIYTEGKKTFGDKLSKSSSVDFLNISMERVLEIVVEKSGITSTSVVPAEAASALAMILLENYGIMTVPTTGAPGCTLDIRLRPYNDELKKFGSARQVIEALDECFNKLAKIINQPDKMRKILLGK